MTRGSNDTALPGGDSAVTVRSDRAGGQPVRPQAAPGPGPGRAEVASVRKDVTLAGRSQA
eukprot:767282-Hanusia_phi.AAC.5